MACRYLCSWLNARLGFNSERLAVATGLLEFDWLIIFRATLNDGYRHNLARLFLTGRMNHHLLLTLIAFNRLDHLSLFHWLEIFLSEFYFRFNLGSFMKA
jgi:hypothetical protein